MFKLIKLGNDKFGYEVHVANFKIRQEFLPAIPGMVRMSREEATKLGQAIEAKLNAGVGASMRAEDIISLFDGKKNVELLIAEAKAAKIAAESTEEPNGSPEVIL